MFIKRLITFSLSWTIGIAATFAQTEHSYVSIPNIELTALKQAYPLEPTDLNKKITFTIWLKLHNKEQLEKLISKLYDPSSQYYQKFLTSAQFAKQYAPRQEAINAVRNYFKQHGMQTKTVYSNVEVTATVKQIEEIFQTKINNYLYQQKIFYGNASAPRVVPEIAPYLASISGLSNIPYTKSQLQHKPHKQDAKLRAKWQPQEIGIIWNSFKPTAVPTTQSLAGFTGAQLRTAYNLASIPPINGTSIDGTGQTIVIIDGCGTVTPAEILSHANHYNQVNNLPSLDSTNFTVVTHTGSPYTGVCPNPDGWNGEILLDVEASHTIAPGANIVLVLTNDVDNAQVAQALNYITNNNFTIGGFTNAYVVSNSWDNTYEAQHEPLDATLLASAAQGLSVNFAAGDCGDQTYNSGWTCSILSSSPSIQYPVSSAYVTAVGGTSLFVDQNWNYAFESGWGTLVNHAFYSGSMGGISKYQALPLWQQTTIGSFFAGGYPLGTVGQYNKRAIPDVAMLADLYTGLLTYAPGCENCYDGGASLATPLFSGTIALVNQARALVAGGIQNPIGLVAPYLYINNLNLLQTRALNLITPPHLIISGAEPISGGPNYAFQLSDPFFSQLVGFNWDSALTIIENQFWNDVVGVGSPNIPNFVSTLARL
ncbi:S53 family peptidase [Legionella sp. D16C41]|uniref:S53 family peptidase n=1 Tax=Legionella sp. D16C41 TaxID=3402688 RepID=UPI003AF925A2